MKELRYLNSGGNLASGDRIEMEPAIRYVATSIATSTNGALRTVPANAAGGDCKAKWSEIDREGCSSSQRLTKDEDLGGRNASNFCGNKPRQAIEGVNRELV